VVALDICVYAILAYGVYSYAKSQAPIAGVDHLGLDPAIKITINSSDECGNKTEW